MSGSTVGIVIEAGLLAVVALFVVALLRSHAEILRRLVELESGTPTPVPAPPPAGSNRTLVDLVGQTPTGDSVKLALGPGSGRTLLAFLSSGCAACEPLWAGLRDASATPPGTRLVVVTKGADRESPARVAALAPPAHEVVMSTAAWEEFAVPATPHFVLVGSDGTIAGRGSAGSWQQIVTLLQDAAADAAAAANPADTVATAGLSVRGSSARAARAEAALASAGVTEGHPSLYPSRTVDGGRADGPAPDRRAAERPTADGNPV